MYNKIKQSGFTLLEMVVTLSILLILISVAISTYDSERSKAEILLQTFQSTAASLLRMKTDGACFPVQLKGLVNPVDAQDTFCGPVGTQNWRGPYADSSRRYKPNGDMDLDNLYPNVEMFLEEHVVKANSNGSGPSNEEKAWILSTRNLPTSIQSWFIQQCVDTQVSDLPTRGRCFPEPDGQVGFLVDATNGPEQFYAANIIPPVVGDPCKGAACVIVANDVPVVVEIDPCIKAGVNVCPPPPPALCPDGSAPIAGVCPPIITVDYCPNGSVRPANGICPPTPAYCPDGITVVPANGVCPKPVCKVGIDPACTPKNPPPSGSGSSSSSSSGLGGYRGTDGQLYSDREQTDVCHDCNREIDKTDALKAAQAANDLNEGVSGNSLVSALSSIVSAIASAIGSILSGIISALTSILSPPPADNGDDSSSGSSSSSGNTYSSSTSSTTSGTYN